MAAMSQAAKMAVPAGCGRASGWSSAGLRRAKPPPKSKDSSAKIENRRQSNMTIDESEHP
jgi:hypothetical protein